MSMPSIITRPIPLLMKYVDQEILLSQKQVKLKLKIYIYIF